MVYLADAVAKYRRGPAPAIGHVLDADALPAHEDLCLAMLDGEFKGIEYSTMIALILAM